MRDAPFRNRTDYKRAEHHFDEENGEEIWTTAAISVCAFLLAVAMHSTVRCLQHFADKAH